MRKCTNSRRTAAHIILRWQLTHEFPAAMLPEGQDRAFVQDLVYTVLRRLRALRFILGELVQRWPKGELEALLYVGAAQILYMPDVPDFAAVSETVKAAKFCDNPSIARVVNAVLRGLLRRRAEFEAMLEKSAPDVRESFPGALYRRWVRRFGEGEAAKLAAWHNMEAITYLARADRTFTPLKRGERVDAQPGFAEGKFIVQDPATALAVTLLAPQPGDRVLDACAAPGGKTVQIAWRGADVTACEVNPRRRARLVENLSRTHLADVKVVPALPSAAACTFDKVLVDAPCSNTGVLRRRPDARWNWSEEKLSAILRLQTQILDACAPLVKPGGVLVYSTCSNEPEENDVQVAAFLARHPEFTIAEQRENIPTRTDTDGAYAAALVRSFQ